jgi:ATP-dependent helicase/nuclease subunit A
MTVHGAKGLQAPLVILPDTTSLPPDEGSILWATDPATSRSVPIWSPRREIRCAAAQRLRDAAAQRRKEEHNRLLYVALTRAEDRLLVCGWQTRRGLDEACWYRLVERGFDALPAERATFDAWDGEWRRYATPQRAQPETASGEAPEARIDELPRWAGAAPDWQATPPREEPGLPERLAPSRPENVELGPVPAAATPLAAREAAGNRFRRGSLLHALLQHLPELPAERRAVAALAWLDRPGNGLVPGEAKTLARETLAILDHTKLAPLFGPGSRAEVPLTGLAGGLVVGGLVDRLAVLDDRVLVADYKTNRRPPTRVADTPVLYRRQMAAYRAVLRDIFPGRAIVCALVWTQTAQVVILPDELLDLPTTVPT